MQLTDCGETDESDSMGIFSKFLTCTKCSVNTDIINVVLSII